MNEQLKLWKIIKKLKHKIEFKREEFLPHMELQLIRSSDDESRCGCVFLDKLRKRSSESWLVHNSRKCVHTY